LSRHLRNPGFTTIELLVGVAIVGILAALAIPSFKTYVYRSRVTEAVTVLNEIKSRQEAYRSRFGNYAAVSGMTTWGNWTPAAIPGSQAVSWPSSPGWEELGLRSPGLVRFRYATVAGPPNSAPPAGSNLDNRTFWYAAQAEGDLDDDNDTFILEVYSQSRTMFNSAAGRGGWE
jgi:prepilin-type N-terminal cleavage/methylation domain-containing protein